MAPRTAEQIETLRRERRLHIIRTALRLFARKGFDATSISVLAREAGMAKGLVYTYFDSKDDLLQAVIQDGWEQMETMFGAALSEDDPLRQLEQLLRMSFRMLRENSEFWSLYFSMLIRVDHAAQMQPVMRRLYAETRQMVEAIFEQLGRQPVGYEAAKLLALLDGIGLHAWSLWPREFPLDDFEEQLVREYCSNHSNTSAQS